MINKENLNYLSNIWNRILYLRNSIVRTQRQYLDVILDKKLQSKKGYFFFILNKLLDLQNECYGIKLTEKYKTCENRSIEKKALNNPTILTTTNFYGKQCLTFNHDNQFLSYEGSYIQNIYDGDIDEVSFYLEIINKMVVFVQDSIQLVSIIESLPPILAFIFDVNIIHNTSNTFEKTYRPLINIYSLKKCLALTCNICWRCDNLQDYSLKLDMIRSISIKFKKIQFKMDTLNLCDSKCVLEELYSDLLYPLYIIHNQVCSILNALFMAQYKLISLAYYPLLVDLSQIQELIKDLDSLVNKKLIKLKKYPPWVQQSECDNTQKEIDVHNQPEGTESPNIYTILKRWWFKSEHTIANDIKSFYKEQNEDNIEKYIPYIYNDSKLYNDIADEHSRLSLRTWIVSYFDFMVAKTSLYFHLYLAQGPIHNKSIRIKKTSSIDMIDKISNFQREIGAIVVCVILDKVKFARKILPNCRDAEFVVKESCPTANIGTADLRDKLYDIGSIFHDVRSYLNDPFTHLLTPFSLDDADGIESNYPILARFPQNDSTLNLRTILPGFVMLLDRYFDTDNYVPKPRLINLVGGDCCSDNVDKKLILCHLRHPSQSPSNFDDDVVCECRDSDFSCLNPIGTDTEYISTKSLQPSTTCSAAMTSFGMNGRKRAINFGCHQNYLTQQATPRSKRDENMHKPFATIHSLADKFGHTTISSNNCAMRRQQQLSYPDNNTTTTKNDSRGRPSLFSLFANISLKSKTSSSTSTSQCLSSKEFPIDPCLESVDSPRSADGGNHKVKGSFWVGSLNDSYPTDDIITQQSLPRLYHQSTTSHPTTSPEKMNFNPHSHSSIPGKSPLHSYKQSPIQLTTSSVPLSSSTKYLNNHLGHPTSTANYVLCCQRDDDNIYPLQKIEKISLPTITPFTTRYFYDKSLSVTYVITNIESDHIFLLIVLQGDFQRHKYNNLTAAGDNLVKDTGDNDHSSSSYGTGEDALFYSKQAALNTFLRQMKQKMSCTDTGYEKLATLFSN